MWDWEECHKSKITSCSKGSVFFLCVKIYNVLNIGSLLDGLHCQSNSSQTNLTFPLCRRSEAFFVKLFIWPGCVALLQSVKKISLLLKRINVFQINEYDNCGCSELELGLLAKCVSTHKEFGSG